jgi:Eco57I restriction-modification methylase
MAPLSNELRGMLERAIIKAREIAEEEAEAALTRLAVNHNQPFASLDPEQRRLRNALRVRVRQLGGGSSAQDVAFKRLVEEVAYEQWHRRLFARILAENTLLMHPMGVPVSLEECEELAREEGEVDGWQLAARYAGLMLPGIFRADDPAVQIPFSPEGRHKLEQVIIDFPTVLLTADDTLGWVYQFWQTKRKKEVNASWRKIGGEDLATVTQLFTEDYMVQFLLENSLGAWWAVRHPVSPLLKQFAYLRFKDDGTPAAGSFPGWPEKAAMVTVMDPCCGSGHFLVAAFGMLKQMRMEDEGLPEKQAADAVLRDNLFGLEIDPRCTQIAAFALALVAWKSGGYRQLPVPNIACSGIAVMGQLETWTRLAGDDVNLRQTLERHYHLFRNAPDLGSLINPNDVPLQDRMFSADYAQVEPLLEKALAKERTNDDPVSSLFGATAEGVAKAARLLADTYTLVVTNVPYLKSSKQSDILKQFCNIHHPLSKADLATVFVERCCTFTSLGGSYAVVTPQNWRFLESYKNLRKRLLVEQIWNMVVNLGSGAFQTPMYEFSVGLSIFTNTPPNKSQAMATISVSPSKKAYDKEALLRDVSLNYVHQIDQLQNRNALIALEELKKSTELSDYVSIYYGSKPGQTTRVTRFFWELNQIDPSTWTFMESSPHGSEPYSGKSEICLSLEMIDQNNITEFGIRGKQAWGKQGIILSKMNTLPSSLYCGQFFDDNTYVILPNDSKWVGPIFHFVRSNMYRTEVRKRNQKLVVDTSSMIDVPFDIEYWQLESDAVGPLPKPYSKDPTQWLFKGNPVDSTEPLQVAMARLLGYRWPQQSFDDLDPYAVKGGIICLPSVAGEERGVERLRTLLAIAYGEEWSSAKQDRLLADVGYEGKTLDLWLRDGFFAQHCSLFHNRPFIWHIWDGLKDGFSALVNYHQLDAACLDRLIYTYLGSWIMAQRAERDAGISGADAKLVAALNLQKKLEAIRDGEPPYDIYVRWKSLSEQPIGWNPDLNDGVRINIRPFVTAGVLRSRFTINWNKDRGTNPDGSERLNDLHYTLAEKREARPITIQ